MGEYLCDGHGTRRVPSGAAVNIYGYPEGTVPWETPEEDMPPGYHRITHNEEVGRLLRLHRERQPGYGGTAAIVSAIRYCVEKRGGRWPFVRAITILPPDTDDNESTDYVVSVLSGGTPERGYGATRWEAASRLLVELEAGRD